jgi:modulator of FtsH protease
MDQIEGWHDLYVMLGGSAAALVGLLFVAISMHAGFLTEKRFDHIRASALHALVSYLVLVVLATCLLIPGQTLSWLGIEILACGLGYLAWLFVFMRRVRRHESKVGPKQDEWVRTFAAAAITGLLLVVVGAGVGLGHVAPLYVLPFVGLGLLLTGVWTSWDLVLRIPERRR